MAVLRPLSLLLFLTLCASPAPLQAQEQAPYLYVLGIAQDAGYPQAGCYAPHCLPGWEDESKRRSASSIAVVVPPAQANYLFDATPDLPRQLYTLRQNNEFELSGVFLTHAHIGHYTGLMFLGREAMGAAAVPVYAMPRMSSFLRANGPWSQLVELNNIALQPLQAGAEVDLPGIEVTPFLVPHRDEYSETVGYRIAGPQKSALFIPDINKWEDWNTDIRELIQTVDYALLDATFYADGELGNRDMSQIPHPFVSESMALFSALDEEQRNKVWFIHFNHSNPLLRDESDESRYVREQGFNIAYEGLKLGL